ncbi:MAG: PadR family transcriptional regulator [Nocardioides sp.]
MGQTDQRRAPRARRGDVRSAILDVLRTAHEANDGQGEPINGYQVIQQIAARTDDAWRPSPGSVYPTIQQLQDEGLVAEDEERGRRTLRLTEDGATHVHENAEALDAVWAPFETQSRDSRSAGSKGDYADLKPEIGQVMSAVWQIVSSGSDQQRRAAIDILVETRRKLYGVLADGHESDDDHEEGS